MAPEAALRSLEASPRVHKVLKRLHAASEAQEKSLSQVLFYLKRFFRFYLWDADWPRAADDHMRDKFVALEQDKCRFMYLLARSMGAHNIIEAGTSFGVSTIYLALAVGQNVAHSRAATGRPVAGKVIATEQEPSKSARARQHWEEAGEEVEPWIELREGDLRETLKTVDSLPEEIDMLLLDIWTPMALPALEIVKPRLRKGAVVLVDNTVMARPMYREFLTYINEPSSGFKATTIPYTGGLEMIVYLPFD